MIEVSLFFDSTKWYSGRHHIRGSAFSNGELVSRHSLCTQCPPHGSDIEVWCAKLTLLNGFFAIVSHDASFLTLVADRVRSIPLFYAVRANQLFVSDNADWVRRNLGAEQFDTEAEEEFLRAGYVTGSRTLFPGMSQVQAGEIVQVDLRGGGTRYERYYRYQHDFVHEHTGDNLSADLDNVLQSSVQRLIEYANGRQIVIPLSGGYDSRIIAVMLKRLAYDNVLTFTYGVPDSPEVRISQRVAKALGFDWSLVPYSRELWREAWKSDERVRYEDWASGWASISHTQDWLAVRSMHNELGLLHPDAVFAPGHTGDFISGGHIPHVASSHQSDDLTAARLANEIHEKHLQLVPSSDSDCQASIDKLIRDLGISVGDVLDPEQFASTFEHWEWQERQSKFIVNSVRVYEFYGYDWYLPLWDEAVMRFFAQLPLSQRLQRRLYVKTVTHAYNDVAESQLPTYARPRYLKWLHQQVQAWIPTAYKYAKIALKPSIADPLALSGRYEPWLRQKLVREGVSEVGLRTAIFLSERRSYSVSPKLHALLNEPE